MRSIARLETVSTNTINKLLVAAGETCRQFHNQHVRNVPITSDIQCDELWSFVYAKDRTAQAGTLVDPPEVLGSVWTFTAIDSQSKLLLSYLVRKQRNTRSATAFFRDLHARLTFNGATTLTLCTDSLEAYQLAFAQIFLDSPTTLTQIRKGTSGTDHSTAYVERHNLTIRMANRRYTRKTNAFSKQIANHEASMHLFAVYYNFCRTHKTLRMTPALFANLTDTQIDLNTIVDLIDANAPKPKKPGPAKGTKYKPRVKVDNLLT